MLGFLPIDAAYADCAITEEGYALISRIRSLPSDQNLSEDIRFGTSVKHLKSDRPKLAEFNISHPMEMADYTAFISTLNQSGSEWRRHIQEIDIQKALAALHLMERQWGCLDLQDSEPIESEGQGGSVTAFNTQGPLDRVSPQAPVKGGAYVQSGYQNSGNLTPARLGRRTSLKVDYLLLLFLIFLSVSVMAYIIRRRPKPREARRIIQRVTRVKLGSTIHNMEIVDISPNGCKIQHHQLIQGQKRLSVELDGVWWSGQIKWQNEGFAGVKFMRPLANERFNGFVRSALT